MAKADAKGSAGSKKKVVGPKPGEFPGKIVDVDVSSEMSDSFLEYAYSVIYSRALPDARDGLKPVHRRILHQMSEMGLRPDKGHVKSARVVGEVMGKLHPHGDGAIYDALVRMAQNFSMRLPLVDGHGNFGSLDAGPAAMRYTEARLANASLLMVEETDENTVDFGANYDGQILEPLVLPAAFPNLLVNGATGIAVGMATNMAPHNLGEVIAAAKHLIENPTATLKQLMKFVPAPDFPTGGTIIGKEGILEAYQTGKGLENLYKLTPLEDAFSINAVALVNGKPKTLGLKELLQVFVDHRIEVVTRRSNFRKDKASARLNLVDGLLKAIIDIDKVVKIIRGSDDANEAKASLIKSFKLTDEQATYILDMPLRRLTKMSKIELETEQKELKSTISKLTALLKSDEALRKQVADELTEVEAKFATPRRTLIA